MELVYDDKGNCVVLSEVAAIQRENSSHDRQISKKGGKVSIKQASLLCTMRSGSVVRLVFNSDEAMHLEADHTMERMETGPDPDNSSGSIVVRRTERGFPKAEFRDRYGAECSIQDSSLASEAAIWLGVDDAAYCEDTPRMHLTKKQVASLLPILQRFLDTGTIAE